MDIVPLLLWTASACRQAVCYRKAGDLKKALRTIKKAIALNPKSHTAFFERGLIQFSLKQWEESIADFNKAIALNPSYHEAFVNRGRVYTNRQNYKKAFDDFNTAIQLNPDDFSAYDSRGAIYMIHFNEIEKACADWKRACELGYCRSCNSAKKKGICLFHDDGTPVRQQGVSPGR